MKVKALGNSLNKLKIILTRNKLISTITLFLILLSIFYLLPHSLASPQPVDSIEIYSEKLNYQTKEAGAWKVTKSAKWLSKGEAEITFNVDSIINNNQGTDVILAIDISQSINIEKLNNIKSSSTEFINTFLDNDKNRVGLITYSTTSNIVSNLTNNKNLLTEKINDLSSIMYTNYYRALMNVDEIFKKNDHGNDRDCIVIFLAGSLPSAETPNEVGAYNYLKKQYPYLNIYNIQYEMGGHSLEQFEKISDKQFIANKENLQTILYEAAITKKTNDTFTLTDYIDTNNFSVSEKSDIKPTKGEVTFDKESQKITWNVNNFIAGQNIKMTINAKLKDEFLNKGGVYSTNIKEEIVSQIADFKEEISSEKTPLLGNSYKVTYNVNAPDGCTVTNTPSETTHFVFDKIMIANNNITCNSYQFKGWKIVGENVEKINDDYFIMPGTDVELRGTWSKLNIKKSMTGEIGHALTLYEQVAQDVYDSKKYAKKYTGDTSTFSGNENVYFYYGEAANNNVIFANYCWKIVRTTDTGGVKIIYNGIPSADGKCNNTGDASQLTAEQMNQSTNTVVYNPNQKIISAVGYMFNENANQIYNRTMKDNETFLYGKSVTFSNGSYTLKNSKSLNWGTSNNEINNYHYTCFNTTGTCSEVYYVHATRDFDRQAVGIPISNGADIETTLQSVFNGTDSNKTSSNIKKVIDYWYQNNMQSYTEFLEDTYWCNDRTVDSDVFSDWNTDSNSDSDVGQLDNIVFKSHVDMKNLTCDDSNDRFTVSKENGNGALTYPVGLVTLQEQMLAYDEASPLTTGNNYWGMSPNRIYMAANVFYVSLTGSHVGNQVAIAYGVRPVVSLRSGIIYESGDGTVNSPYVIDLNN